MNKKMVAINSNEIIVAKNLNELRNKLLSRTYRFFRTNESHDVIIVDYKGKTNLLCYFWWGTSMLESQISTVFLHGSSDDAEQDIILSMLDRCIDISLDKFIANEKKHLRGPKMDFIFANNIDKAINIVLSKSKDKIDNLKGEDVLFVSEDFGYQAVNNFNPNGQMNDLDIVTKMKVENGAMCITA